MPLPPSARFWQWVLAAWLVAAFSAAVPCEAKGGHGGRGKGQAQRRQSADAWRQQTIKILRAQLATARSVLAQAESQLSLSSSQLDDAKKKLASASDEVGTPEQALSDAIHVQKDLEDALLDSQEEDSKLGRAAARRDMAAKRFDAARDALQSDPDNSAKQWEGQQAKEGLDDARQQYAEAKRKLLEGDSAWKEARDRVAELRKQLASQPKLGSLSTLTSRREARAAAQLAEQARAVIAVAEARLRALGVNPNPPKQGKGRRG